jgi:hypothetical protein
MIEITTLEAILLIWAAGASAAAGHYYGIAKHREKLLMGASIFTKKLIEDDHMRDELRAILKDKKEAELKFGMED